MQLDNIPYKVQVATGLAANVNSLVSKAQGVTGELKYTTDTKELYIFDGTVFTSSLNNAVIISPTSITRNTITIPDATYKGLVIKGAGSQSANLQEWQNSSGTVLSSINKDGWLGIGTNSPNKQVHIKGDITSSNIVFETTGYDTRSYFANYQGATAQLSINRAIDGGFSNPLAASSAINLTALYNNSYITIYTSPTNNTTPLARFLIDKDGYVSVSNDFSVTGARFEVRGYTDSIQSLVRGFSSQTANLTEWQNSSGTALAYITSSGDLTLSRTATPFVNIKFSSTDTLNGYGGFNFVDTNGGDDVVGKFIAIGNSYTTASRRGYLDFQQWGTTGGIGFWSGDISGFPYLRMHITGGGINDGKVGISSATEPWTPSARFHIKGVLSTDIQEIVQGASSQSANLTEWQNSSGTVLSAFNKDGWLGVGTATPLNTLVLRAARATLSTELTGFNHGFNTGSVYDKPNTNGTMSFWSMANGGVLLTGIANGANPSLAFMGMSDSTSPTVSPVYFVAGKRSGTDTVSLAATEKAFSFLNGATTWGVGTEIMSVLAGGQLKLTINDASTIGHIVKGASSQTANLTEWQNSSGTVLAYIEKAGLIKSSGRKQAVTTKSADYTLTTNDEVVVFTTTATATLPAATGSGQTYRICCRAGTLTIDANGSETVKGELTQTLSASDDLILTDTASGIWE